jgi:hypothetical protein
MRTRFICERCGVEAPTREVLFRFNVAMIFVRQEETTIGHFCKRCVHRSFWAHTGLNLALVQFQADSCVRGSRCSQP